MARVLDVSVDEDPERLQPICRRHAEEQGPSLNEARVLRCAALPTGALSRLLGRFGLRVERVPGGAAIPGSYWGEPEAGIVGETLWVRDDTPVHSALHEACHVICMDAARRARLHTDAGGDDDEENGVNYLAIVLADQLQGFGAARLLHDMDAWGYTFRLGSAAAWFAEDAEDARRWLLDHDLIDHRGRPTWRCRDAPPCSNA